MKQDEKPMVGGQAVIEGVMMRSPQAVAVACRKPNGKIVVKTESHVPATKRWRILNLPIIRGGVVLVESLVLGIKALMFSGDVAMLEESGQDGETGDLPAALPDKSLWEKLTVFVTLAFSLGIGLFIFFYLPLLLVDWMGIQSGFWFNLVDGVLRLGFFLVYLWLITKMKDIRRVFEYHGAEHKSIFTYENSEKLAPEIAQRYSRFHPRCGTSFLLIVMVVSVLVFLLFGRPESIGDRFLRLTMVPIIGGISYELIRLSDKGSKSRFWKFFILPGLWSQRLTTREPDLEQLEVAIVALRAALGEDMAYHPDVEWVDAKPELNKVVS